jgi:hypothetical protein
MIRTALISTLAAATLVLAGCGGGDDSDDKKADPDKATTAKPTPTETVDPFAANLGDRALSVGQTRDGQDVHTTLQKVKYPYPAEPDIYREPKKGNDFVGLRIEQCVDDDATVDESSPSTYNGEFAAVTASGDEYAGSGEYWDDWPAPKFPESKGLVAGRCLKGWLALEVPKGTEFSTVIWRPEGTPVAEWKLQP